MTEKERFIGGFKLVSAIGGGRDGEVWAAITPEGSAVAVKLFPEGSEDRAREEYETGLLFDHPNLLRPLSFGTEGGRPYMVMPFCEGRSLDNLAGYLREEMAWKLFNDISEGLAYLHSRGYCHADVKPSNILWDGERFLLSDFGACFGRGGKRRSDDASSYRFAAPGKDRSAPDDIWSLGASVFNAVMGSHLFNGLGGQAQRKESPLPIMRKSMPELSALVIRCLDFDPGKRPSAEDIMRIAGEGLENCRSARKIRPARSLQGASVKGVHEDFWPEKMKECSDLQ